jgi:hypothetical protein
VCNNTPIGFLEFAARCSSKCPRGMAERRGLAGGKILRRLASKRHGVARDGLGFRSRSKKARPLTGFRINGDGKHLCGETRQEGVDGLGASVGVLARVRACMWTSVYADSRQRSRVLGEEKPSAVSSRRDGQGGGSVLLARRQSRTCTMKLGFLWWPKGLVKGTERIGFDRLGATLHDGEGTRAAAAADREVGGWIL